MSQFIITGTDTDAGKTHVAAHLVARDRARYWKPLQSGTDPITGLTDRQRVQQLSGLPDDHFLPEVYAFSKPLSPHRAAELEGIEVDVEKVLAAYQNILSPLPSPLYIEGAGGLMVPITRSLLQIDLFVQMQAIGPTPIILVARTTLGTINHTLLSVAAIRARGLPLHGIFFFGPDNPDNIRTIADFTGAEVSGHLAYDQP
jgi:dethiobiotin synthetase